MQDDNARKITYGAMMTALSAIILAVSFYVPLLGGITMFFIPLPIILYRLRYDRTASILVVAISIILSLFIGGGIALIPLALVFGLLGLVIGDTIRLGKSKLYTFMASGLTLLTLTIIMYVGAVLFFKINIIEEIMKTIPEARQEIISFLTKNGELPVNFNEQLDASILFYEAAIPSLYIIGVFSLAFIYVSLNLIVVKRLGHNVQSFPPFRDMKLPMITVWYYLLVLLSGFLFNMEHGTTINLIYTNASLLLQFLFFLQGISLILYLMNKMKLPKWALFFPIIFALLLSPITIILGVLDAGMGVRRWIGKDKSK